MKNNKSPGNSGAMTDMIKNPPPPPKGFAFLTFIIQEFWKKKKLTSNHGTLQNFPIYIKERVINKALIIGMVYA